MSINEKKFIVCRASAGSGKTFKLVNEYLKLCLQSESKFKFSKILAITFTNKASAEMKERIIEHLRTLSSFPNEKSYSKKLIDHYCDFTSLSEEVIRIRAIQIRETILHNYTSLSISTIDKFTHKLIRSFARDLRLSADFDIQLDPNESLSKSTDELISLAGQDEEVTEILENYVEYLVAEGSNWQIEKGIKQFGKQLIDEEASLYIEKLSKLTHEEFKKIFAFLNEFLKKYENKLTHLSEVFFEIIAKNNLEIEFFNYGKTGSIKHFVAIRNKEFDNPKLQFGKRDYDFLADLTFIKTKYHQQIGIETKNKIDICFIELNEIFEKERPKYFFYSLLRKNIYNLSLIKQFSNKLTEIHQNENTLLIGEFNKIISEVVKNDPAPFIYERIGERYQHILIDEFQDTSILQFNNLLPLIENSLANSNKCLIVGDPKQAIYRWRGGDIDQFILLPEINNTISSSIQHTVRENFKSEELHFNYRSGMNIVNFNNQFFQLASSLLDQKYQSIYSSLKQESKIEGGYVEFNLFQEDKLNGDTIMLTNTVDKINECIKDGFKYSDITILTRNKKEGILLVEKLNELNIPVISGESLLLSNSNEVLLIMNVIRNLAHPNDSIAKFKIIELNELLNGSNNPEVFDSYRHPEFRGQYDLDAYLKKKKIELKRLDLLNHTSYQLILETIKLFLPNQQNNYLRFLIEYVYNNWKNKPVDVLELCKWWEENSDKLSIQSIEKNDAVQIMTIHASKGLQFPVVIIPFAGWRTMFGRDWIWVDLNNDEIPLETTIVKSNASHLDSSNYSSLKQNEKNKTDLDDLNLLYVAFTRPETRLYILSENTNTMTKKSPFIQQILEQKSDTTWSKGEKMLYISKQFENHSNFTINYSQIKNWEDRLRLSITKENDKTEQEEIYRSKKSGILLHTIFEKFSDLNLALEYLEQRSKNDKIIYQDKSNLEKEIKSTFSNNFIKELLSNKNTISECSIVDENGKTYRPDKVLLDEENVIICDFKTGSIQEKHKLQLDEYAKIFSEMNFKSIKKYLFYTKESKLLEV
jgi:ATP-dependent exoDNAse (exonuclease V) beta subunit